MGMKQFRDRKFPEQYQSDSSHTGISGRLLCAFSHPQSPSYRGTLVTL